jgi:hypothetical protein
MHASAKSLMHGLEPISASKMPVLKSGGRT